MFHYLIPTSFVVLLTVLASCSTYVPLPLEGIKNRPSSLNQLFIPEDLDLDDGLQLDELGAIALSNNPNLKVSRFKSGIAKAEFYNARLLPDLQLGYGIDRPSDSVQNLVNAYSLGVSFDVQSLIARSPKTEAAKKLIDQWSYELLWQEWQVLQQAKILSIRFFLENERLNLLEKMEVLYSKRYSNSTVALEKGDTTLDVNGSDLVALLDTQSLIIEVKQIHNETKRDLNMILGLNANADTPLIDLPDLKPLNLEMLQFSLQDVSNRRPDLVALKLGYEAQEAKVRGAILGQFPNLGIALNRSRDTGNLHTTGFSISLDLPIFNGNRGNIAIERATRAHLQKEYQQRLTEVNSDVVYLLNAQQLLQNQIENLKLYLPKFNDLIDKAKKAYSQGDIDAVSFLNLESTWLNKQLEQINLLQSCWENNITLSAMLAEPFWPVQPSVSTYEQGKQK